MEAIRLDQGPRDRRVFGGLGSPPRGTADGGRSRSWPRWAWPPCRDGAGPSMDDRGTGPVAVAVLPFERPGDGDGTDYLAIGLSDGIGTELSRLRGAGRARLCDHHDYRRSPKPLTQIGAELGVRSVFRGSVQRSVDRVRVDADCSAPRRGSGSGSALRATSERAARDPARHVRATVEALRIRPTKGERDRWTAQRRPRREPTRPTCEGGRSSWPATRAILAQVPAENIRRAQSLYSRARDLDPGFGIARARLAPMHTLSASMYDTTEAAASRRGWKRRRAPAAPLAGRGARGSGELLGRARVSWTTPSRSPGWRSMPSPIARTRDWCSATLCHRPAGSTRRLPSSNRPSARARKSECGLLAAMTITGCGAGGSHGRDRQAIALAPEYHIIKVIKGQA